MPIPPMHQPMNTAHSGHPLHSTGVTRAVARAMMANPASAACRADTPGKRLMSIWPPVQHSAPPTMTKPCTVGEAPWMRSAARGTKLSTPMNVAAASMRQVSTAGYPAVPVKKPCGSSRRSAGMATAMPMMRPPSCTSVLDSASATITRPTPAAAAMAGRASDGAPGPSTGVGPCSRIGRLPATPTTSASGNSSRNTQRHPNWSVIHPANSGATRLGTTQPAEM